MVLILNVCVLSYFFGSLIVIVSALTTPPGPEYEINPQNVEVIEGVPAAAFEYTIVPSSEYNLKENSTTELSLVDCILNPLTSLANMGFNAVSIIKWILITVSPVLLGMGLVIAFCAFTDYCTLTIEYPFSSDHKMSGAYLDNAEHFVVESYNKYNNLQSQLLS